MAGILLEMSRELQWLLIKNNSSFIIRRKGPRGSGVTFTTEPNNLKNKNSYKYNGLVNAKAVDVTINDDGNLSLHTKVVRKGAKPAANIAKFSLGKERRRAYRMIRKRLGYSNYRRDLLEIAVRRASALAASKRPIKRLSKQKRKR